MRKVNNSVKHDPENGTYGDCHRACFSMILGISIEDIPHFFEEGDKLDSAIQNQRIDDFLAELDLVRVEVPYPVNDYQCILTTLAVTSPGVAYILGGTSSAGCGHSIVCYDGEIFHDPTGRGLVGPMADGHYWVTFFSPKPDAFSIYTFESEK